MSGTSRTTSGDIEDDVWDIEDDVWDIEDDVWDIEDDVWNIEDDVWDIEDDVRDMADDVRNALNASRCYSERGKNGLKRETTGPPASGRLIMCCRDAARPALSAERRPELAAALRRYGVVNDS